MHIFEGKYASLQQVLERLEMAPGGVHTISRLDQGFSGAEVYRLRMVDQEVVLKFTPQDTEEYIRQRAEREESFYAQLAPTLSIGVPQVLGSFSDSALGTAILFPTYRGIKGWSQELFQASVKEIARLHAAFWEQSVVMESYSWINEKPGQISEQRKLDALSAWKEILTRLELTNKSQLVERWIGQVDTIAGFVSKLPRSVVHGDYHPGNYLQDDAGNLLLTDWQEICYGNPLEDVSFFSQRGGGMEGIDLVQDYVETLRDQHGIMVDLAEARQVVLGYELISRLLDWPDYLGDAEAEFIDQFLCQVQAGMERF